MSDETSTPDSSFRYDLVEEIARGGMGVVYRATQHGSGREVAVKMILGDQVAAPGMLARFLAEAEAIASLDHPNILPIYETGETDGGPFYSMKLAEGGTLRERLATFREKPRDAARLMAAVARAVHHAHERGILHRDLKPGNILLGRDGTPYVADFGIARWLNRDSSMTLLPTALGTPYYVAPEQAAGASKQLTTAADIYSLGAILYELLSGQPPFTAETPLETMRLAAEAEPARLSGVPRDLAVICLKCLAKEPAGRYASAAALAEDLERWLEGRTIAARPTRPPERLWRWAKRNPVAASLAAACITLLLATGIGSAVAAIRIAAARDRAVAAERDATEKLYGSYIDQARASRLAGRRFDALDALEKAGRIQRSRAVRDETIAALALVDFRTGARWAKPPSQYSNVGFDTNLERYLVEERVGELSVREVSGKADVVRLIGPASPLAYVQGFSRDGRYVAAKFLDDFTWIWELPSGRRVLRVQGQYMWTNGDAVFSPDSRIVAVTMRREGVAFYRLDEVPPDGELDPGRPWREWKDAPFCHRLAFNPAGTHLAMVDVAEGARVNGREGIFQVRALADGAVLFEHRQPVGYSTVDWSPDGTLVAVGSWDHQVHVHEVATSKVRHLFRGHLGAIIDVRFSHDGQWLATMGFDKVIRLWDVASGSLLATGAGSDAALRFSADDRRLGVSFLDGAIGWLEIARADVMRTLRPAANGDRPWTLAASRDGRLLASSGDGGFRIWNLESRQGIELPAGASGERIAVGFAADSSALLGSYRNSGLHRWPLRWSEGTLHIGTRETLPLPVDGQCLLTDVSADGERLAVSYSAKDFVSLVPTRPDGSPRLDLHGHPNAFHVVISPDGKWAASGTRTNSGVRVWNVATGEPACDLEANTEARPVFSADSRSLVTGSVRGYQFWHVGTWEKGPRIEGDSNGALSSFCAAFSPNGNLLAVQQNGDRVSLHDSRDATLLAVLEAPKGIMAELLRFTGDGTKLAVLGANQVIQLWDIPAIRQELRARGLDWAER